MNSLLMMRHQMSNVGGGEPTPPPEWNLILESASFEGDISTDQKTFGPQIEWVEGVQFRFTGTIEIISVTDASTQSRISDANTQTIHIIPTGIRPVGYSTDFDVVINSTRSRRRAVLIGRLHDGKTYAVRVSNFKAYQHI